MKSIPRALRTLYAALCGVIAACGSHPSQSEDPGMTTERSAASPATRGYRPVNGIQIYYEIHGEAGGTPLVLLPDRDAPR